MSKIFIVLLLIYCSTSGADDAPGIAPEIQRILNRGKLVVAMHKDDVPPFSMMQQGKLTGIDVEIAHDIALKLGVPLEINRQSQTYDEVVEFVALGKADIAVSLVSSSLQRAKYVFFSEPYMILKQALLINRLGLASLKGYSAKKEIRALLNHPDVKIGTVTSTSYVEYAQEDYPVAEIIHYDSWKKIIAEVKAGKLLAAFYDEIEINNWNKAHPEDSLYLKTKILTHRVDPLAIVVNRKDFLFLEWINLYISHARLNGYFKDLKLKYLLNSPT